MASFASLLGPDDYAWFADAARRIEEAEARFDDVDGVGALWGNSDSDSDSDGVRQGAAVAVDGGENSAAAGADEADGADEAEAVADARRFASLFQLSRWRRWASPGDGRDVIHYRTSCGASGHGDVVWSAADYVAASVLRGDDFWAAGAPPAGAAHGLAGKRVVELGAGLGLPGLAFFRRGASVVLTDAPTPASLCCLAANARRALAAPRARRGASVAVRRLAWGAPTLALGRFDVVVACDCVYNPIAHSALLQSILDLLSESGVAIVAFALHGNAKDADVLSFFDAASAVANVFEAGAHQMRLSESMAAQGMVRDDADGRKRAFVRVFLLRPRPGLTNGAP
ncbi:putative methyltransferase-domain-containing protein [Pelagophyceae sp. CCMP2097]|nr:putative methyltransferase-domain-containing protein [Pelagophyceae sp. CCMP2097]